MHCVKSILLLTSILFCGCTTNQQAAKSFSTGYQPIKESINQTLQTLPRTRRLLGIEHYLKNLPTEAGSYGASKDHGQGGVGQEDNQSFANFVCAGKDTAILTTKANLLVNGVTGGLAELSTEPPKEVGKLWDAIGKVKVPGLKLVPQGIGFEECITLTRALILEWENIVQPPPFKRSSTLEQELAPLVGLSVGIAAYDAMQKLLTWSLQSTLSLKREVAIEKLLTDAENRKELLAAFDVLAGMCNVPADENEFDEIAKRTNLIRDCEQAGIGRVFKRHKQTALQKPYIHYKQMLRMNKNSSEEKDNVRLMAIQIDEELEIFDKLLVSPNPGFLASKAKQQFQKLLDVVDKKSDWQDAYGQLVIFAKLVNDLASTAGKIEGQVKPAK